MRILFHVDDPIVAVEFLGEDMVVVFLQYDRDDDTETEGEPNGMHAARGHRSRILLVDWKRGVLLAVSK